LTGNMTPSRVVERRADGASSERMADRFARLADLIRANAVGTWVDDRLDAPGPENLTYLAKFAYLTGLITKAQIRDYLDVDRNQAKLLVRGWYDEHRRKGCGMC
jgi:hypothetical protein